jgi:trk system potassium uptake protein TrkH
MLPIASNSGSFTSPVNALFTATSAICVTGLAVVTGTHWSIFGQVVILLLIQIGGFGYISIATVILIGIGRRLGLKERLVLSESIGLDRLGGILGVVIKIAIFVLLIEVIGAAIIYIRWLIIGQPGVSLWTAFFHAVSAFNNCGLDLFGDFKSLAAYNTDATILLTTAVLIILGGIGYVVVMEYTRKRDFYKLSLDSKMVLVTTFSLLLLGTLFYLIAEYSSPATLGPLTFSQKLVVAFFQSVTPRTAGFTAIDIGSLKEVTLFFTMFLMFVGGGSGSAAGGVKVNTFGVLALTVINLLQGKTSIGVFGRQVTRETAYRALTLVFAYLLMVGLIVTILSITENLPIDKIFLRPSLP